MVFAWDGADPVGQDDPGTGYELGVAITVNTDITVNSVRVWHPASSNSVTNRSARFWTTGGVQTGGVLLADSLPPGWSEYELDTPLELTEGSSLILSYSTTRYYGAVAGGFPNDSADAAVTYTGGLFRETFSPLVPNTPSSSFYGVDLGYELGIGGNLAPVVTVGASAAGRTVTAVATVEDESPGSVTYRWEWGDGQVTSDGDATEQHTYAGNGIYAVLVTVTDNGGLKDSAAVPVVASAGTPGGMVLADVMGEIAARLDTIDGVNVYQGWPKKVIAPAVIVAFPDIDYDTTYARGADTLDLPIVVLLTRLTEAGELSQVSAFGSGFGSRSIKAVVESGAYTAMKYVRVRDGVPDVHTMAGVEYLAYVHATTVVG